MTKTAPQPHLHLVACRPHTMTRHPHPPSSTPPTCIAPTQPMSPHPTSKTPPTLCDPVCTVRPMGVKDGSHQATPRPLQPRAGPPRHRASRAQPHDCCLVPSESNRQEVAWGGQKAGVRLVSGRRRPSTELAKRDRKLVARMLAAAEWAEGRWGLGYSVGMCLSARINHSYMQGVQCISRQRARHPTTLTRSHSQGPLAQLPGAGGRAAVRYGDDAARCVSCDRHSDSREPS